MLPNISRSKVNQTMKLGQLIEYKKIKNFLQKLCKKKMRQEASPRPFLFTFIFPDLFFMIYIILFLSIYFLKELNMRYKKVLCS